MPVDKTADAQTSVQSNVQTIDSLKVVIYDSEYAMEFGTIVLIPGSNVLINEMVDKLRNSPQYAENVEKITIQPFKTELVK